MMVDWTKLRQVGSSQLGKPYQFGYKPANDDPDPQAFDCSALVRWLYAQVGITVPDGSENQFEASVPVPPGEAQLGDVGFFRHPNSPTHHVGLYWSKIDVLEARGEPFNQVIYRPVAKWEAWPEFTGWRRFKVLL